MKIPDFVRLFYATFQPIDIRWAGPVRVTSPARTIRDCVDGYVQPDLIHQAVEQGLERRMFEKNEVVSALRYISMFDLKEIA